MRKDMKKVLVNTYRLGANKRKSQRLSRRNSKNMKYRREILVLEEYENEDGDSVIDIADSVIHSRKTGVRDNSYNRKQFGENLNPLARFVRSNVGRPWDNVYSEICEQCDTDGAVSGHIFDHLWDLVIPAHRVFYKDGEPWHNSQNGPEPIEEKSWWFGGVWGVFYVDPNNGILKECKKVSRRKSMRLKHRESQRALLAENTRKINEDTFACRSTETGLWFVLSFKEQEWEEVTYISISGEERVRRDPVLTACSLPDNLVLPDCKKGLIVISCRSASKKEIRDYIGVWRS